MTCKMCKDLREAYKQLAHVWVMAADELAEAPRTATAREKYLLHRTVARARAAAENARLQLQWHEGQWREADQHHAAAA